MSANKDITDIVNGFLNYLDKTKNRHLLPEIIQELSSREQKATQKTILYTATKLTRDQQELFTKQITNQFGSADITFVIDPTILGGIKLLIGDTVIDLSKKAELDALAETI